MNMNIDGKTVFLNRRQEELVWQAWENRRLEEKAAKMLECFSKAFFDDLLTQWLDASRDRDHLDYICDVLAQQFRLHRSDDEPDADTWYQVIRQELNLRQDVLADSGYVYGCWLQRPLESLVRLCWRNRHGNFSVTFTMDETLTDAPSSLFNLTLSRQPEGILQIKLQDACSKSASNMLYYPDEDGQPQCDFNQLEEDIREYLEVYTQMRDMPMRGLLWVQQY